MWERRYDSTSFDPASGDVVGARFRCDTDRGHRMVGFLDAQPSTTTDYHQIDWGFYCDNDAALYGTENWGNVGTWIVRYACGLTPRIHCSCAAPASSLRSSPIPHRRLLYALT